MAFEQANDYWLIGTSGATTGLLVVDASGSSRVALTVTTQAVQPTGTPAPGDVTAAIEGSNDRASWFLIATSPASVNVGVVGVATLTGEVKGYVAVRVLFTRFGGTQTLISATINTGP